MADGSGNLDVQWLLRVGDDLASVLKDKADVETLNGCHLQFNSLQNFYDAQIQQTQHSLQDYQRRIEECKKKTEVAKLETANDSQLDLLQKELDQELENERALEEELRFVIDEISGLERKGALVGEQARALRKIEQDDLKARTKLAMYASMTNVIPNLNEQHKVSGSIVNREKLIVEKFEFDPADTSAIDTCNNIWKLIDSL